MSKLIKKFLTLDTTANGVNAQVIPANFASPSNYTPGQVGSEGTLEISSHLKGIDTALGATEKTANKGAANGYAPLDGSGKVPLANLPSAIMEYQGSWDPTTNTPALSDGTGTNGNVYWVSALKATAVSGLTDPSMVNFQIGDIVIYSSSLGKWQLVTPAAGVSSVNGSQGAVTVNAINQLTGDVTAGPAAGSASAASTVAKIQGTTVSGTTGSGNVVFSNSPALVTPNLGTPSTLVGTNITGTAASLTAGTVTTNANLTGPVTSVGNATSITNSAITNTMLANMAANTLKGNNTGSAAAPTDLTGAQVVAILPTATAGNAGVLSSSDWSTFNGKQAALGFTPENVANKSTDGTMAANSATLYPSQSAVVTYVAAQVGSVSVPAAAEDAHTVTGTDITNGYFDLSFAAKNTACIELIPVGGITQQKVIDYSISLTGGAGGVTRITWSALGLASVIAAGDVIIVDYVH